MAAFDHAKLVRLAFWAFNMMAIREQRTSWPGFSYTEREWKRFSELASAISPAAFGKFLAVTSVVFIALAGVIVVAVFVPVMTLVITDSADLRVLTFALLMAIAALLAMGIALPLAMSAAARVSADEATRSALSVTSGDAELAAKVSWQLLRMSLILCGLLVPLLWAWIVFDLPGRRSYPR